MTYWCQGKEKCTFQATWLLEDEATDDPGPKPLFYVYNQGKPVQNYLEAFQVCQRYFDLKHLYWKLVLAFFISGVTD